MITREMIIEKLKEKYPQYSFIPTEVIKNGDVRKQGIIVRDESPIAPTIYTDSIIERYDSLDEAVEVICNMLEQNIAPDLNLNLLQDKNFILERIRIGVQKCSDEQLVKREVPDFPGMEAYLYFIERTSSHDSWSVRLRPELMKTAGIDEAEAWSLAEQHTFAAATITSMAEILAEMTGMDIGDYETPDMGMYVISNEDKTRGAASILNHDMLKQFAEEHGCSSIVVIPSSIHECILVPIHETIHIEEFDAMVREVNATQVAPEDVLVDRAYIVNFD